MSQSTDRFFTYRTSHRFLAASIAWLLIFAQAPPRASAASHGTQSSDGGVIAASSQDTSANSSQAMAKNQETPEQKIERDQQVERRAEKNADKLGEISIAQPKIWQYERVNTLLDGLLRDVEGVSVADLLALDANTPNGAAVKFVQSMLDVSVKYDQAAGVQNGIAQQNYQAMQGIGNAQIQANTA